MYYCGKEEDEGGGEEEEEVGNGSSLLSMIPSFDSFSTKHQAEKENKTKMEFDSQLLKKLTIFQSPSRIPLQNSETASL